VENIAHSGDEAYGSPRVPLENWPDVFLDPQVQFEFHPRFFGFAVRTDRWTCRDLSRDWHTLYLVMEGESPLKVDGRSYVLGSNSFFWLSPDVPHDMRWSPRFVFTELWFRAVRGGEILRLSEPAAVQEHAEELWPLMRGVEEELMSGLRWGEQKIRHLLALVAIETARLRARGTEDSRLLGMSQRRRLSEFARQHVADRLSPADLAEVVGLSPDYFSRVFHRTFGCSPRDWLVRERIREASRMLTETPLAVFQVARHLGYANVSQFSRQFREVLGVSPGRYRRRR
jgi:AraC-like DNA-binding protein